jgi:hypothetical protein
MPYDDYTRHQQGIIKRYYRNLDSIQSTRLAELTTELYLADGKKRDRLWTQALDLLAKLEVPQTRIDHIASRRDPALLASLLQELERQG